MRLFIAAPNIYKGDAVGNHCLGLSRMAARIGLECQLYARGFDCNDHNILPINNIYNTISSSDTLLLSHSIYDPDFEQLIEVPCRKICYFHGITPPDLLRDSATELADLCRRGLEQIGRFQEFDIVIANSVDTLSVVASRGGAKRAEVIPPLVDDMNVFLQKVKTAEYRNKKTIRLLCVGRVVPHKRVEDVITLLSGLIKNKQNAELTVVGDISNVSYFENLIKYAKELNILDKVVFSGIISENDLYRVYQTSDMLITTSLHEGFCVPVLEALHFHCGVLVRKGTAAEYLVGENERFEMTNDVFPDEFLQKYKSVLVRKIQPEWGNECNRMVHSVLNRCADDVWENILI